jgi:hypothetical protein
VASHWYKASAEEREKIAQNALRLTESGRLSNSDPHDFKSTIMLREEIRWAVGIAIISLERWGNRAHIEDMDHVIHKSKSRPPCASALAGSNEMLE